MVSAPARMDTVRSAQAMPAVRAAGAEAEGVEEAELSLAFFGSDAEDVEDLRSQISSRSGYTRNRRPAPRRCETMS